MLSARSKEPEASNKRKILNFSELGQEDPLTSFYTTLFVSDQSLQSAKLIILLQAMAPLPLRI